MAIVEHFEIPVDDIERAQAFYTSALGFDYEPWGAEMGMLNQPEGKGINGDLHLRADAPHPTVVFTVDDIEAAWSVSSPRAVHSSGRSSRCRTSCAGSTSATPRATSSASSSTTSEISAVRGPGPG